MVLSKMEGKGKKLYSYYMPIIGSASLIAFSVNVMEPATIGSIFGPFESAATNALWFNAHIGIGMYLYTRKHMKPDTELKKVGYSAFGSVTFNFGTLLLVATMKGLLPQSDLCRVLAGLLASGTLLYTGKKYLQFIDESMID